MTECHMKADDESTTEPGRVLAPELAVVPAAADMVLRAAIYPLAGKTRPEGICAAGSEAAGLAQAGNAHPGDSMMKDGQRHQNLRLMAARRKQRREALASLRIHRALALAAM
ncbi:hypothetical protein ABIE67_010030 [Streptomyces sp. V4I8]|uniref:hypothetical protein n=1 Tax=Streptomyces sp. V4I8 TaxID=3156469 RepID=UPI0035152108